MELPIASQSYAPSQQTLVRAAKRARVVLGRVAAEEHTIDGGTLLLNPGRPGARCANFAADLVLEQSDDATALLQRVLEPFAAASTPCHSLDCADEHWPDALLSAAQAHGFGIATRALLRLDAPDVAAASSRSAPELQIVPARSLYPQLRDFYARRVRDHEGADARLAGDVAAALIDHLDEPRLELYVGRIDGEAAGIAGALSLGNIGVIYNVYVLEQFRGRRVGPSLLRHTLEYCHRALFEQVIVDCPERCPAIRLYESFGFQPLSTYQRCVRPRG